MNGRAESIGRWLDVWLPLVGIIVAGVGAYRLGGLDLTLIVVGALLVVDQRV